MTSAYQSPKHKSSADRVNNGSGARAASSSSTRSTGQVWNAERYARDAQFVVDMGADLLTWLKPVAGERILDVGCGEGSLTQKLVDQGALVTAVDSSSEQIALAQKNGLHALVMDAAKLTFTSEFDAVFSNAAYHWVEDIEGAISSAWRALKPGGRLVAEFGGAGNIQSILAALDTVFSRHGLDMQAYLPWHFRSPELWSNWLREAGFIDVEYHHYARPTPINQDITGWLELMAGDFLNPQPPELQIILLNELREALRPALHDDVRGWWVDYVRLRVKAFKPVDP